MCYVVLCYVMLFYAVLCYVMLCYAMLFYAMVCYAILCCYILYYIITINSLIPSLQLHISQQSVTSQATTILYCLSPPDGHITLSLLSPLTHNNHDIAFDPQRPYIQLCH